VRSVGAAAVTAGLLFVPLASAATFGRPAEIPLVRVPVSVVVFDATQDGGADVVVANASGPALTLLPGRQDGSFERPIDIPGVGRLPRSMVVGDFDNDGGDDLVAASEDQVTFYVGVDASLARGGSTTVRAPSVLAAGDLDSDGNLDLVAGNVNVASVSVLLGLGDGTFQPPQQYAIGLPAASLLVADLNEDEAPDVAASGDGVSILYGNGDGTLRPYESGAGFRGARGLAAEDFDGDGLVDLAITHGTNLLTVIHNEGDERFVNAASYPTGGTPVQIAVGDVDGDGSSDLVTANQGTNDVSVLLGEIDGGFRPQFRVRVGRTPVRLALEDLDGLGTLDLVTANRRSKTVTVLLNGADAPQPVVCVVPGVVRRKFAVAQRIVAAANCKVTRVRRKYSNRVKRGRVIAVSPLPGTRLPPDSSVTLLVSRGPRKR
jgi:hypothetical protein